MKRKRTLYYVVAIMAVAVIGLLRYGWYENRAPERTVTASIKEEALPGMQESLAPWPPELARLRERLDRIGLPALMREGTVVHIHEHLDIFVDGNPVAVPAAIGINNLEGFISPLHTHDASGTVHIESPTAQKFTLGQFFDVWGVRLTADCVGGYCRLDGKTLQVFSNGQLVSGDPRALQLEPHQEIAIIYGQLPQSVPSAYPFPPGS